jgi:hypothetical protein
MDLLQSYKKERLTNGVYGSYLLPYSEEVHLDVSDEFY